MPARVFRPTNLAAVALLTVVVAACGGGGATTAPTAAAGPTNPATAAAPSVVAATTSPATAAPAATGPASALAASFCQPWAAAALLWPPISVEEAEAAYKAALAWSKDPALASVAADLTKIANYLAATASTGARMQPSAEDQAAFDRIQAFATANC